MKIVTLKSLHIQNFGNIKDMTIDFDKQTYIKGRNESGKTTIGDAYSWLMTNHLMNGGQADGIRPIKNGVREDFVDIIVEAVFDIGDRDVTIQKTQSQEWTKKDGKFKGNVNKYMINGIPKKEKEYREYIEETIMMQDRFELCTNASSLLKMDTAKRRKTLFGMVSELSDEDIIDIDLEFEPVRDMLRDGTVEELISRARYQISGRGRTDKGLQGKLDEFPSRIDEASKKIVDVEHLRLAICELQNELDKLEDQEQKLNDISFAYDDKSREIVELRNKQSQMSMERNNVLSGNRQSIQGEILDLQVQKREKENNLRMAEMDLKHANMGVDRHTAAVKKAQEDWKSWSLLEFNEEDLRNIESEEFDEDSLYCPTCGQRYPLDKTIEIRDSYEANKQKRIHAEQKKKLKFEEDRDIKLTAITESGNKAAVDLKEAKKAKEEAERKIAELKQKITSLAMEIQKKQTELSELPESVDLSNNVEYQKITAEIAQAEEVLKQMDNSSEQRAKIKSERDRIVSEISSYQTQIKASHDAQDRVDELETQRKETAQKLADCQRELDFLRDFQKKKCEMLTEKINALFKYTKWVLFKFNEGDDGYREICEPSYKGVKYNERLNHGGRSLIDLDICNAYQNFCGASLPIVLDDFDGVTENTKSKMDVFDRQVVYLVADECDLKVEYV